MSELVPVNPTSVSEIFDNFLSKISDYSFLSETITDDDINEELMGYLKSATVKFYKCKNSLKIVINDMEEYMFVSELTPFEIEILTTLMIVEYMKPQVLSSEVIKQSLSDKDFRIYSQANQLRELNLLYRMFRTEATKMITEYTYFSLDKENFK
ncbi:hypothetical protein Kirov_38 [Bacillus phage Kirov]|uniref:Uncharacterized protein n=1 Tax=Bacillus phage Kirov TaxID=2783539 RepID=A0A7S6TYP9_9CAUD|nr:hypothetical protein PQE67_gp266 [Bacillus phage Kirov]QOV08237.1 hypothetical protein Kirov_38 [Bacillus phage Kirov]